MPTTIKISDELLAKIGATAANAEEKIAALLASHEAQKTEADNATAQLTALTERVTALEGRTPSLPEPEKQSILATARAAAVTEATRVAGEQVAAAIAKVGVGAVGSGNNGGDKATFADLVKLKTQSGMSQADAIRASIKEFPKEYAEWRKTGASL